LDLGTGTGVVIRACAARLQKNGIPGDNVRLHGADISDKLLAQARRLDMSNSITWTKLDPADGGRLPYADGEFDVIVMHTLLSHVPDPVSTLRDAARCLKKRDGRLVVFDADHAGTVYGLPDFQKMMDTNLKLAVAIATQVRRVDACACLLQFPLTCHPGLPPQQGGHLPPAAALLAGGRAAAAGAPRRGALRDGVRD
jgi:ubiquinone/menaquinone biosynthesis C-methylase UbiE